jgi:hypothetical protein
MMSGHISGQGPEIISWRGDVLQVHKDTFDAILWRNDGQDPGDNRRASIVIGMVREQDVPRIEPGALFDCRTIIPPPKGEPIVQDIVFRVMLPLRPS